MTPHKRHTAPRLPEFLLNRCLAPEERFALTGDLNEEYLLFVRPQRGRLRAEKPFDFTQWRWRFRDFLARSTHSKSGHFCQSF